MERGGARLYILRSTKQEKKKASEFDRFIALKKERAEPLTQTQHNEQDDLSYYDSCPVASSDGKFIYFMRAHRNRDYSMGGTIWVDWDLYKMQLSNNKIARLTHSNFYMIFPPQVSSKSGEVIFSFEQLTPPPAKTQSIKGVMVINKQGQIRRLPTKDINVGDIGFGESDNDLIFISDFKEQYDYELCISDMSFTNPRILTDEKIYLLRPRMDRQKKIIYFLNDPERNGRYQLWYLPMKPNGSGKAKQLADSTLFTEPLKWRHS